jgi:class 3 adenylate cyclase
MPAVRLRIEVIDTRTFASAFRDVDGDILRVGSAPDCECRIDAPDVAGEHFRIVAEAAGWRLQDGGSPGGTFRSQSDGWARVQGAVPVGFPLQLKISPCLVLRIAPAPAPEAGGGAPESPPAYDPSYVVSIQPNQLEECIFVLDMCGSSALASANEKIAFHLKRRMREITHPILVAAAAQYIETTGDGWRATFGAAARGVSVARAIRSQLGERNRSSRNPPIQVRIALHFGKTYIIDPKSRNRHGSDLNIGFRVEGVQESAFVLRAGPLPVENRILCTRALLDRYRQETGRDDLAAVPCGVASLKGIDKPVEIYAL